MNDLSAVILYIINKENHLYINVFYFLFSLDMMPHMMPIQQPDVPALPNKILFLTQLHQETTQMMLAMLFNQYCFILMFLSLVWILPFLPCSFDRIRQNGLKLILFQINFGFCSKTRTCISLADLSTYWIVCTLCFFI